MMGAQPAASWRISEQRSLSLDLPRLMGILNVTPDSFSDGGSYPTAQHAIDAAMRMMAEGADIIDIGGESTRPGSQPVDEHEQIRRTIPVIEGIRRRVDPDELLISIDTTQSAVAKAALDAGANIINDVSAGRDDRAMFSLASSHRCGLILMHRRVSPHRDSFSDQYAAEPDYGGNVVDAVRGFLSERCAAALRAGVHRQSIVLDPGLGFGKSVPQNYELIAAMSSLTELGYPELGYPVLSAASRKSFIGAASGQSEPSARLAGSLAVSVAHYLAGVRLFRVHDVAAHREALAVAQAIVAAPPSVRDTMPAQTQSRFK